MEEKERNNISVIFKEFGERVRKERIQKGYSFEDVTAHLKISLHVIKSIEEGNFDTVPYFVYLKGFIRSYALFLGITDYEIRSFFQKIEAKKIEDEENNKDNREKKKKVYIFGSILFILILGCFFYFDAFGIYNLFKPQQWTSIEKLVTKGTGFEKALTGVNGVEHSEETQKKEEAFQQDTKTEDIVSVDSIKDVVSVDSKNDELKTTKEKVDVIQKEKDLSVTLPSALKKDAEPVVHESETTVSKNIPNKKSNEQTLSTNIASDTLENTKVVSQENTKPESEVKPIHINKPGQRNVVIIKGVDECWVHSTADAKETRQFSIQPGQLFALSFHDSLVLKLGNAGGVEIKYNGEKIPPVGRRGQVKTITLSNSNKN